MKPTAVKSEPQSDGPATNTSLMDVDIESGEDDDDDDSVVLEMDVYLAPELSQQLHLLQYPIHQRSVPNPVSAKIKPRHGILEADYPVYKESRPRTYSSATIPISTHLCLGRVVEGALHMVPLHHLQQMRPSFEYLDEPMEEDEEKDNRDGGGGDKKAKKQDTKQPVALQRKESERAAVIRERSFAFKKQSENAEAWLNLKVIEKDGGDSSEEGSPSSHHNHDFAEYLEKSVCHDIENDVFVKEGSLLSYIQSLNYLGQTTDGDDGDDHGDSTAAATLTKKVVALLDSGALVPFSILCHALPSKKESDILEALTFCAVLVRGNWCLQSKYLQMDRGLQELRNLLLLVLQEHGIVYRQPLVAAIGQEQVDPSTSQQQVRVIFQSVARKADNCWEPKISDNHGFLEDHASVAVQQEEAVWKRMKSRFADEFQQYSDSIA